MGLPEWLDLTKIGSLGVLILAIVQYVKNLIPEKWIRLVAIGIGIGLSFACECYLGKVPLNWVKAIVDGVLAAVLADTGYQFLSRKGGGNLTLPSK